MGITTWGHLRSYLDSGGTLRNMDQSNIKSVITAGLVLDRAVALWKEGRPNILPADELKRLKFGSDTQIEDLVKINNDNGNDGRRLIDALRSGVKPRRWQDKKTDELETILRERGFIVDEDRLDTDEIRVRVLGKFDDEFSEGLLRLEKVDELMAMLP